jgi:phosphate transport system substrate-binding protein
VVIPPSVGSTGGIRQVWEGEAELGRVARDFKKHELNYSLKRLVFARDMVVFVVGSKVGVTNLSAQQLADVFSGKIENWKQVGGNDYRVRLLIREADDSSLTIVRQQLENFKEVTFPPKAKILFHDSEMIRSINKYTTAIGWLTFASMKEVDPSVTALSIDGVSPTLENVYDGKYFLSGDYALIYEQGKMKGLAEQFVNFIFSKKGNRILIKNGIVPVNHTEGK